MEKDPSVYECLNCSRPVFKSYLRKETVDGKFSDGVEEFLIFEESCWVVLSPEIVSFNGNLFYLTTCRCKEELGYMAVLFKRPQSRNWYPDYYYVRGEKVKVSETRPGERDRTLRELVDNNVSSLFPRGDKLAPCETRVSTKLGFMDAAVEAANEVAVAALEAANVSREVGDAVLAYALSRGAPLESPSKIMNP